MFTGIYGRILILVLIIGALGAAGFWYFSPKTVIVPAPVEETPEFARHQAIGTSVEGRAIEAYHFGTGEEQLLFVGGLHGGYEWNSVYLAYRAIDYLEEHPNNVPENMTVTIIPSANPDGLYEVVGSGGRFDVNAAPDNIEGYEDGRFNANGVDLNRNFDCKWQPESSWRGNTVSAGTSAFSEPEARALRDFILENKPAAVVFWHSKAGAVYASECEDGILQKTMMLMNTYANAAGYSAVDSFDAYEVTGDAEGWLASIGIPAITVELTTHEHIEWEQNRVGIEALLGKYGK